MLNRITACAMLLLIAGCSEPVATNNSATGIRFLSEPAIDRNFQRADAVRDFAFPVDHGMHSAFATEWWYFTGNLRSADERRFGFELTFFRYALSAGSTARDSNWGSNQVWLAHFTLTDVRGRKFHMAERMGRGALGIAGAATDRLSVSVRDWTATAAENSDVFELDAGFRDAGIKLQLSELTDVALHGERGLDQKGAAAGNASYYYSIPRMSATGRIRLPGGEEIEVAGTAWLDREWGTSSLDEGVEGWDWFGLQLSNDIDLMLYRLRNTDGSLNEFGTGSLIYPDGRIIRLAADDIDYEIRERWTSPSSDVTYPIEWDVSIPSQQLRINVSALLENQEFNLGLRYWEGAVDVSGTSEGVPITGVGYLELAGYL